MNPRLLLCVVVAFATRLSAVETAPAASSVSSDALEIARRSLPFVMDKGAAWIEKRECTSCHQIPAMLWSLNSAARAGLDVDRKDLAERTTWAVDWQHWLSPGNEATSEKAHQSNSETMAFLLMGRDMGADKDAEWAREFRRHVIENQQPDGSWKPQGQLPLNRRPAREISEVSTMWALLALKSYGSADDIDPEVKNRAESFLATAQPGKSTEWHALKLLLQPNSEPLRADLLQIQHADGGWGWLTADASDAFATGQALYALARSGLPSTAEPVQKAIAYLKTTQQPEGSWQVPSTRAKDKSKAIPTSIYWGTAWAVIGLLESQRPAADATAK
jgi:squalene-hopene/tetraprenyl-beta-curcumene cyclase